jgi:hypothetical protein
VTFRLLAKWFPYRPPPGKEHITLEQLRPQFARWEIVTVLVLFVCAPFTVWGAKIALAKVFLNSAAPSGAAFHFTIDPAFLLLPAIFLGLILAAAPTMGTLRLLLGKRFSDYMLYGNLKVGFDSFKIWVVGSTALAVGALALTAAVASVRFTVFPDRLEIRHVGFSARDVWPYSRIASVAPKTDAALFTLTFADGTHWSTSDDWSLLTVSPEAAHYIASRVKSAPH